MLTYKHAARWRTGRLRTGLIVPAALALGACEFPTSVPQVDQRWIVPPQTTTIAVGSLLPAGVRFVPDSSAFTIDLTPSTVTRPLSADCPQCAAANGTRIPKPAFIATATVGSPLPTDIASAMLSGGTLDLSFTNNYTFDPLRPSASAHGYLVVTVMNGSTILGRDSVDGAAFSLAPGATLLRSIPLAGAISSASPVTVTASVNSPAGDSVTMDASRTIVALATPSNLRVPTATVNVVNRIVGSSTVSDLGSVDATITSHLTDGALLLDVVNPFTVGGTLGVRFSGPGIAPIDKAVALAPGTTHPSIALTQAELQTLFGHVVTVSFSGPVNGTAGPVSITPKQVVVVTSRLDVGIHTGG
jgi:hypothetical protein